MNLIDTEKLSLETIFEFRKDEENSKRIRDLHLFVFENYQDKPLSYIEDDICKRIEEHNSAIKKWGLDTTLETIELIFSREGMIPAALGTITALACGYSISQ